MTKPSKEFLNELTWEAKTRVNSLPAVIPVEQFGGGLDIGYVKKVKKTDIWQALRFLCDDEEGL